MPAQRLQQAGALDQREELPGAEQAKARMLPAYQRLDACQSAVETDLGLIVDHPLRLALRYFIR
ncbi:hypothetical protein D3C79_693040 [compost metagenome]